MYKEREYRLWLSSVKGMGPVAARRLLAKCGESAKRIFDFKKSDFDALGLNGRIIESILKSDRDISGLVESLTKRGVWYRVLGDSDYPEIFNHFDDLPFVVYGLGQVKNLSSKYSLSVVGSRRMSDYGFTTTKRFLSELLSQHPTVVVVSGMAIGIDSVSHWSALNHGAKTVAVLGTGVDVCYPASNKELYKKIIESDSTIISEFPIGQSPQLGCFPMRNRIIAALSNATFVVEAASRSGTLITAREALNYGKNLGVLPGRVDMPNSVGALRLIKEGAEPIVSAADLKGLIGLPSDTQAELDMESKILINTLLDGPKHFEEILLLSEIRREKLIAKLSVMATEGIILDVGAGYYSKE